jgi:hypothetical protein
MVSLHDGCHTHHLCFEVLDPVQVKSFVSPRQRFPNLKSGAGPRDKEVDTLLGLFPLLHSDEKHDVDELGISAPINRIPGPYTLSSTKFFPNTSIALRAAESESIRCNKGCDHVSNVCNQVYNSHRVDATRK